MTLDLDPAAVRRSTAQVSNAGAELASARQRPTTGADLGPLDACVSGAATDLDGVLSVAGAILEEFTTNVEACLATYAATDHASAGSFHALHR